MGGASSPSLLSPAAPAQKWPAPTGLQGAPAFNVVRTDAAFAANIDNRKHTVAHIADGVRRQDVIATIERPTASGIHA